MSRMSLLQMEIPLIARYGKLLHNSTTRSILWLESTSTSNLSGNNNDSLSRILYTISSDGQFSITSNASYMSSMNVVMGDLYVGINPNTSVANATLSVKMQASNVGLFDQTQVCFALSDNATGLAIYVCSIILLQ